MEITKVSSLTGKEHTLEVPVEEIKYLEWESLRFKRDRPKIQDFFPELNRDLREFILSGITPEEWDYFFGE